MSATIIPPATSVGGEWDITESTYGVYARNCRSGAGISFETAEDAAAVEAMAREARHLLGLQAAVRVRKGTAA